MKALLTLLPYLRRHWRKLAAGLAFVGLNSLLATIPAQLVRHAIDHFSNPGASLFELFKIFAIPFPAFSSGMALVGFVVFLIISVTIVRGAIMFAMRQAVINTSREIEAELRADTFRHVLGLPIEIFHRYRTGDLMARLTEDLGRIRMALGPGLLYGMNLIIMISVIMAVIFSINAELALYIAAPLPVLAFAIYRISRVIYLRSERIQQQLSALTSFVQEAFSGIRIIKAFATEPILTRHFHQMNETYRQRYLHYVRADALFFPAMLLFMGLSTLFTLYVGGQKVISHQITAGHLAELFVYLNMLMWPVASIGWIITLMQRAAASQGRINQLLNEKNHLLEKTLQQHPAPLDRVRGEVAAKDISFRYSATSPWGLQKVSLKVGPGHKIGITGRTGSGKSTLAHLLVRLYDVPRGQRTLDAIPYERILPRQLRQRITIIPQESFLFSETIGENLIRGLPREVDWQRPEDKKAVLPLLEEACRTAAIYEDIRRMPHGFDTLIGERGVNLSGGQKQRLSLARGLLRRTPVYILDDALSAVDAHTEAEILHNLQQWLKDAALIVIAHRVSQLKDADEILILSHGRIVARGTHDDLLRRSAYYAHIYRRQLQQA